MACGRLLVLMINRHQRKASSRFRGSRRFGGGLRRCHDQAQLFRGAGLSHHSGAAAEAAAGGIGGLLARTDHSTFNLQPSTSFYHADGNGNITCMVDDQNHAVARYIYDPFGNIASSQGPLAEDNLYRFSSKEFHPQSGLVYYLYRYYEPNLQRWVNRDPYGERGGVNLYSFVMNRPTRFSDRWGLAPCGGNWGGMLYPPYQGPGLPSQGNCWRFACGDPAKPGELHSPKPPGWDNAIKAPCPADACKALMSGINEAGGQSPGSDGRCPSGYHKITVQYSPDAYGLGVQDAHFSTECPDGTWKDKPGTMEPKPVSGPNDIPSTYQKCGETCVPDGWDTDGLKQ